MKYFLIIFGHLLVTINTPAQSILVNDASQSAFTISSSHSNTQVLVDSSDHTVVIKSAALFAGDIKLVTGREIPVIHSLPSTAKQIIIIGSLDRSPIIKRLVEEKKLDASFIIGKWEGYIIQLIDRPFEGIGKALVITGSDRRGTSFAALEMSKQIGVSPWYWWADVPAKKRSSIYVKHKAYLADAPRVKYRGIFINDEAPALANWSREKFGGFNHKFYEKVFELMLRLKSNYLWPAMWGNAFYDDDSLNIKAADDFGIVIGTSHHEPLMRAHAEWRKYGKNQKWNYDSTETGLKEFWREGMRRATNEKIVSLGMRGDGDEPMSRETAITLLERIVRDQREIISEVTGMSAEKTPQLWALYKEVQDYYDKGMRVPDDVTLLLCDDNWGNIRRLPQPGEKPRKGGYGIYYHFDYVGGPRNYKWVNTNPIARVWEQMHLAWEYKAREIWIVNVGDIKPMEFPISFFLDYAWNPEKINADDLQTYTENWAAAQFGKLHSAEISDIISKYSKYNGRRKLELLDEKTFNLNNYNEFRNAVEEYSDLLFRAEKIYAALPTEYRDAFYQLVLHPVKACTNLYRLYYTVAMNRQAYELKERRANELAEKAKELYTKDSLITLEYHNLRQGKWNHMMSQTHIGYTYWQQPLQQKMPDVFYVPEDSIEENAVLISLPAKTAKNLVPKELSGKRFYEINQYVSIDPTIFTKAINTNDISWKILPDHGKTGSAITTFPVTAVSQTLTTNSPHLQYEIFIYSNDVPEITAYFSPTLNFQNSETGLRYAISLDDEEPQIISINKEDYDVRKWEQWVAENIIKKKTMHKPITSGNHVLKFWMIDPGVVLQKIVVDMGGVKESYLGPPFSNK